jgi:HPt (histidine-containing phosphotransfer) domain-containing protein
MNENLFSNLSDLDTEYLDAAYANDAETAALVFEQYLADLPANLEKIKESLTGKDIERFKHHIHKQKPGYSYVGLTDVTHTFQELQVKCVVIEDLNTYQSEIENVLTRINSSTHTIEKALHYLRSINEA